VSGRTFDHVAGVARLGRAARLTAVIVSLAAFPAGAWCSVLRADEASDATSVTTPSAKPDAKADIAGPDGFNAQVQSEAGLADAIADSEAIREILRGVILPGSPLAGLGEVETATRSSSPASLDVAAAAPDQYAMASRAGQRTDRMATVSFDRNDTVVFDDAAEIGGSPTMGQVLRSAIVRSRKNSSAVELAIAQGADDVDDDALDADTSGDAQMLDLRQRVLKSRLMGLALESILQVDPFDSSFSIFGLGQFEVEIDPTDHSSTVTVLSNAGSIPIGLGGPPGDTADHPQGGSVAKITLRGLVQMYLDSPLGLLTMIGAGALFFMWALLRITISMRRSVVPRGFK